MQEGYLIDTNVISELRRREPEPRLVHGFEQRPAGQLYLSVLTLGEIRRGVEKLQQGERQRTLRIWLEQELPTFFAGRLIPWIRMGMDSDAPLRQRTITTWRRTLGFP
jgi:predicted nucleic acid-binding protein